jgi:hypothetical protein
MRVGGYKKMDDIANLVKEFKLGSIDSDELRYLKTNLYYGPDKLREKAQFLSIKYKDKEVEKDVKTD